MSKVLAAVVLVCGLVLAGCSMSVDQQVPKVEMSVQAQPTMSPSQVLESLGVDMSDEVTVNELMTEYVQGGYTPEEYRQVFMDRKAWIEDAMEDIWVD